MKHEATESYIHNLYMTIKCVFFIDFIVNRHNLHELQYATLCPVCTSCGWTTEQAVMVNAIPDRQLGMTTALAQWSYLAA